MNPTPLRGSLVATLLGAGYRQAARPSPTVFPVIGPSLQVSDRDDHEFVWSQSVNELIRKPVQQNAARLSVARTLNADLGVGSESFDCGNDGVKEVSAEARTPALVPLNSVHEFVRSGSAEANRPDHRPRISFSIRRLT